MSGGRAGDKKRADDAAPVYSVLIPLEFTRGMAERCVAAWTSEQRYARERFEIVIAAPTDHDPTEISLLRSMLGRPDRILELPLHHDMDLVAAAATASRGTNLVFTEAHCLPEPDFLQRCDAVFAERPAWGGFSGRSIPMTHNALSEVEAEMYVADIARNLGDHPWLKVLDQCFVVTRDAYDRAGGLEPEFGHFAEFVLAAQLYRTGVKIGHDPRPAVRHQYVGETPELIEFARDFGSGRMRFASRSALHPCGELFRSPPAWTGRSRLDHRLARRMLVLLARDLPSTVAATRDRPPKPLAQRRWTRHDRGRWLLRAMPSRGARMAGRRLDVLRRRASLRCWLLLRRRAAARASLPKLNHAAWHMGALEFLLSTKPRGPEPDGPPAASAAEWICGVGEDTPALGLHGLERREGRPFRWFTPEAMVALRPVGGRAGDRGVIEIDWASPGLAARRRARFYVNERRIPPAAVVHAASTTSLSVDRMPTDEVRVGWVGGELTAPGDARRLGLAVHRISIREEPSGDAPVPPDLRERPREGPLALPRASKSPDRARAGRAAA